MFSLCAFSYGFNSAIKYNKVFANFGFCEAAFNLIFSILSQEIGLIGVALGTLIGGLFSMLALPILIRLESEINFEINWKFALVQFTLILIPFLFLSFLLRECNIGILAHLSLGSLIIMTYIIISLRFLPQQQLRWFKVNIKNFFIPKS